MAERDEEVNWVKGTREEGGEKKGGDSLNHKVKELCHIKSKK